MRHILYIVQENRLLHVSADEAAPRQLTPVPRKYVQHYLNDD